MTQPLHEQPAILAEILPALADAPDDIQTAIGAGLIRALGLAPRRQALDWTASPRRPSVEGIEEFCARISRPCRGTPQEA